MKQSNLKISSQLYLLLGVLIVVMAGFVASTFFALNALWTNTQTIYDHPLTVRTAVGKIEVDVLYIHSKLLHLVIDEHPANAEAIYQDIDAVESDINRQMDILYDRYLGPKTDLDAISDALVQWKTIRSETQRLYQSGDVAAARLRIEDAGVDGAMAEQIMKLMNVVSTFAQNKATELYTSALSEKNTNTLRITLLSFGVLIAAVVTGYFLRRGILPPLEELTSAAESMRQGKLDARVRFRSRNEMGVLSAAFNSMAGTIQSEMTYRDNLSAVSFSMANTDDLHTFCREVLQTLLDNTDSQIGVAYLLNEPKKFFEPFESIGANASNLRSFSNSYAEGELGLAVTSRSIRHITNIPDDVNVVFSSVSGDYRVKEIVTVPILNGTEVAAILSLASMKSYSPSSMRLIKGVYNEISARMLSLLNWQKILDMTERLQRANSELQQQAKELEMQTIELTEQNTELELQKKQLDEASRLKTNFLSNMSHELRTPLNSVIALTGVLRRRLTSKIPAEEFSYLEVIERNGKGLLTLINDILDISRIESGREEVEIESFSLTEEVAELVALIAPQAEQKGITLSLEPSDEVRISSDSNKVHHILQNILGNAVKFTEQGGVKVTIREKGEQVFISVKDTGIGIAKEELPFIFDEFRQADGSTSRRFGGTGLGLAISKKYADMLNGYIQVASTVGEGSEFTLMLPVTMDSSAFVTDVPAVVKPHATASIPKGNADFSQKTILLVEDNESAMIQMQDLLSIIGCRVLPASNAEEAFRIISRTIPDAMILDLMMPGIDGFKVLETIRNAEVTAHVPVLILTAKQITKDELHFLKRNNIHQLIQKGDVNIQELQKAITGMFESTKVEPVKKPVPYNAARSSQRPTVLVVEDHPDNMITIRAMLKEKYEVLEAVDAHSCINIVSQCTPRLVLLDIALPDINGVEVFHQIRAIARLNNTPVVALTASAMRQDRETILAHGFDGFIGKPIDEKEFYRVIDEVLYGK